MASIIKVDKLDPQSGTALEIGTSGDTVTVPTGVGLTLTDSTLLLPTTITSTTEVLTNKISPATGVAFALGDSGDTFTIPSGATITNSGTATGFGGGKVGQVVSAIKTDLANTTSTTAVTTGLAVAITPVATSSKIFLQANIGSAANSGVNNRTFFAFDGGNTATYIGDAATGHECVVAFTQERASYGQQSASMTYLDSPSTTSEVTYSIFYWGDTGTTYFNSSPTINAENGNAASSITAIEILV